MVAAAIAIVLLCACFCLLIWVGLLSRPVFDTSSTKDTVATKWPGYVMATSADLFMTYNIMHTTLLGGVGYLVWSGSEPYTPPTLNASYQGRFYTAMMCFYFIYVALDLLLINRFASLKSGEKTAATVIDGFSWLIVLVLAFACGDVWSFQWSAPRAIGLAMWLAIPVLTFNCWTLFALCGFTVDKFHGLAQSASSSASFVQGGLTKQPHLKF